MSKLNQENLVKLFGVMLNPLRMVIEFCPLPDLYQHLSSTLLLADEIFTIKLKTKLALDIANGMNYLSTRKPPIVHRDLRSPNVHYSYFYFLFFIFYFIFYILFFIFIF